MVVEEKMEARKSKNLKGLAVFFLAVVINNQKSM